jgi:hypothetical protein
MASASRWIRRVEVILRHRQFKQQPEPKLAESDANPNELGRASRLNSRLFLSSVSLVIAKRQLMIRYPVLALDSVGKTMGKVGHGPGHGGRPARTCISTK